MNKLACALTKWTKACDARLARLISYIDHTIECRQCCYVGNKHNNADLDYFKTLILQETLKTQNQHQEGKSLSWMCKKQTSVSHSSSEAEIISLDADLRTPSLSGIW